MRTIITFLAGVFVSTLFAAGLIYVSLGELTVILFALIPIFILAALAAENERNGLALAPGIGAVILTYSVMFSPWYWTSLILVAVLALCGLFERPMAKLSYLAAWMTGLETASVGMEYLARQTYYFDNLWHDVSIVVFAVYALAWDHYYTKKGVIK